MFNFKSFVLDYFQMCKEKLLPTKTCYDIAGYLYRDIAVYLYHVNQVNHYLKLKKSGVSPILNLNLTH